jgi:uncharacterized membrane protein YjgN (DUF898 family)
MQQRPTADRLEDTPATEATRRAADAAAVVIDDAIAAPSMEAFSFTGRAAEYFGIWIVNVLLSVLTLGIYSAWAKVRNKRYFYGNTILAGHGFDYLASPVQILKGRLIVVAFLVLWSVAAEFYWWVELVMLLAVLPLIMPWAVVRALTFAARYSSHRNVRFDFSGRMREAFVVYVLLGLGDLLTLGMLHPYTVYRRRRFRLERSSYGGTPFSFSGTPRPFYRAYGKAVALALPFLLIAVGLVHASGLDLLVLFEAVTADELIGAAREGEVAVAASLIGLAVLSLVLSLLVPAIYVDTRLANYAWSETRLGPHRFGLDLAFGRVLWLWFSNLVAIVVSIGLLIPWARVRMARYRIERLRLAVAGSLDGLIAAEHQRLAATGDELGEALGLDLGF